MEKMEITTVHWGDIRTIEKNMETTVYVGFRV